MYDDHPEPDMVECPQCNTEYADYTSEGRCVNDEGICLRCYIKNENWDCED